MTGVLHLTLLLDEAMLLLGSLILVLRPRPASWLLPGAWALQVLLLAQGVVGLARVAWVAWVDGGEIARPGLFATYLLASLALLPLAGALVRRTDLRLAAVRLGAGAALAIVLQLRLADLWAQRAG